MTLALAMPNFGLVAVDRRWTYQYSDGRIERKDEGGKLRQTVNGWVTGAGDGFVLRSAFKQIGEGTRAAAIPAALQRSLASLGNIEERYPDSDPGRTRFLDAQMDGGRASVRIMDPSGHTLGSQTAGYFFTWPPEIELAKRDALEAGFVRSVEAAVSARAISSVVLSVVELFAAAADGAPSMSPSVDIGVLRCSMGITQSERVAFPSAASLPQPKTIHA